MYGHLYVCMYVCMYVLYRWTCVGTTSRHSSINNGIAFALAVYVYTASRMWVRLL